jgi:hypothetical protein
MTTATIFERLRAPFPPEKVSWRIGQSLRSTGRARAMMLAYIDARDVADRLDEVLGLEGWQNRYSHAEGKTVCEIGIRSNGEWIWRADGAGDTDVEGEKGALSDAFKRAAVRFGIGRYLYDVQTPWVDLDEHGKVKPGELARLAKLLPRPQTVNPVNPEDAEKATAFIARLRAYTTIQELAAWGEHPETKAAIAALDHASQTRVRGAYSGHVRALRMRSAEEAAA